MPMKKPSDMEKLTAGYEKIIKGRELKKDGKTFFDKTLKKAAKPKGRASK
jgi:hypothetical protein